MFKKAIATLTLTATFALSSIAQTTLWQAASSGNTSGIDAALASGTKIDDLEPGSGATALLLACNANDLKTMEYLIGKGASVDLKNGDGETPLGCAVYRKDEPTVKLLVAKGADVNLKARLGMPMTIALTFGSYSMVELLYNSGVDIHAQNESGLDATQMAVVHKNKNKILQLFATPPKK